MCELWPVDPQVNASLPSGWRSDLHERDNPPRETSSLCFMPTSVPLPTSVIFLDSRQPCQVLRCILVHVSVSVAPCCEPGSCRCWVVQREREGESAWHPVVADPVVVCQITFRSTSNLIDIFVQGNVQKKSLDHAQPPTLEFMCIFIYRQTRHMYDKGTDAYK